MRWLGWIALAFFFASHAYAQDDGRAYAGALLGVSTLSADARSIVSGGEAATSLYKPENGLAVNAFAGYHVGSYFSVQANYIWNRNALRLVSVAVTPQGGGFFEQARRSRQHAFDLDGLLYFRARDSRIRPYLGTGLAVVRFSSEPVGHASGDLPAPGEITAMNIALRSHVGIDVTVSSRLGFRYSFSETLGGNPVSPHLTPAGERGLMNFQNLFGFLVRF